MNGGYVMIKSSDSEIYSKIKKAIEIGKPILYYENDTTCYYIDSASIVGTDVVLTKGGKTITIDSSNNVVSSGDILTIMENIVDSNGNKRFVDIPLTPQIIPGVTFTYSKCSLSGTHLMIVLAGSIDSGTSIASNTELCIFDLPEYIKDKIVPIISTTILYNYSEIIASDYTTTNLRSILVKNPSNLDIRIDSGNTFSKDYVFRIQYDLLIDNE